MYPENTRPINEVIEKLLNELPPDKPVPLSKWKKKKGISVFPEDDHIAKEQAKTRLILE